MHIHLTYHILIHMLIYVSYISFTHAYTYLILTYHIMFHFLFSFIYILLLVLVIVYLSSHNSAIFFISCYLSYSSHLHILVICFIFMFEYTLEVDMGNYKGPKALLSLYETMNSIRARRRYYHCTRQLPF